MNKKICVCGDETAAAALDKLGYTVLTVKPEPGLPGETGTHADMLVCPSGGGVCIVHSAQTRLKAELETLGVAVVSVPHIFGAYPLDAAFNVAVAGGFAVGRENAVPAAVKNALGCEFVNVKQGYAKCSTCFAGKNAVITEDKNIAAVFSERNFDVLMIEKGDVYLSERHYGFFGGATGSPDENTLLINGSLRYHRDGEKIRNFLFGHGVKPVELKNGRITDIGSVLFVRG